MQYRYLFLAICIVVFSSISQAEEVDHKKVIQVDKIEASKIVTSNQEESKKDYIPLWGIIVGFFAVIVGQYVIPEFNRRSDISRGKDFLISKMKFSSEKVIEFFEGKQVDDEEVNELIFLSVIDAVIDNIKNDNKYRAFIPVLEIDDYADDVVNDKYLWNLDKGLANLILEFSIRGKAVKKMIESIDSEEYEKLVNPNENRERYANSFEKLKHFSVFWYESAKNLSSSLS